MFNHYINSYGKQSITCMEYTFQIVNEICRQSYVSYSKKHCVNWMQILILGGDLSSFQCIAAADKNTCMDFESCSSK